MRHSESIHAVHNFAWGWRIEYWNCVRYVLSALLNYFLIFSTRKKLWNAKYWVSKDISLLLFEYYLRPTGCPTNHDILWIIFKLFNNIMFCGTPFTNVQLCQVQTICNGNLKFWSNGGVWWGVRVLVFRIRMKEVLVSNEKCGLRRRISLMKCSELRWTFLSLQWKVGGSDEL